MKEILMKIDLYTKIILTVIAIGVSVPILTNPPITNKANAFGGGGDIISAASSTYVYHLKGDKIRSCYSSGGGMKCSNWSN